MIFKYNSAELFMEGAFTLLGKISRKKLSHYY